MTILNQAQGAFRKGICHMSGFPQRSHNVVASYFLVTSYSCSLHISWELKAFHPFNRTKLDIINFYILFTLSLQYMYMVFWMVSRNYKRVDHLPPFTKLSTPFNFREMCGNIATYHLTLWGGKMLKVSYSWQNIHVVLVAIHGL